MSAFDKKRTKVAERMLEKKNKLRPNVPRGLARGRLDGIKMHAPDGIHGVPGGPDANLNGIPDLPFFHGAPGNPRQFNDPLNNQGDPRQLNDPLGAPQQPNPFFHGVPQQPPIQQQPNPFFHGVPQQQPTDTTETIPPNPSVPDTTSNVNSSHPQVDGLGILNAIKQMMIDRGQTVPDYLTSQIQHLEQVNLQRTQPGQVAPQIPQPDPTQQIPQAPTTNAPNPQIPAPTVTPPPVAAPINSAPALGGLSGSFGSDPTSANQLGNRSIPGFANVGGVTAPSYKAVPGNFFRPNISQVAARLMSKR